MDQGSGLVRRAELHPAHVNESQVADHLIVGDERAVYADRAYEHQDRRRRLRAAGVRTGSRTGGTSTWPGCPDHWRSAATA